MGFERIEGCWTALVTPFTPEGNLDIEGLRKNVRYQIECGVHLVPTGTTGESPTLEWHEHIRVIKEVYELAKGKALVMAGTGSNSTAEAIKGTKEAVEIGVRAVLLIDCYYNAPSTLELRTNYYEVIAKTFPYVNLTPYIIPSRTGTQLSVEDLYILNRKYPNIRSVKEASADLERIAKTRRILGNDFDILSGDDGLTLEILTRPDIRGQGVISVISNLLPLAVKELVEMARKGELQRAFEIHESLKPLFEIVSFNVAEEVEGFNITCKYRNPTPIKTIMRALGIPAGPCRPPLGRMGPNGLKKVKEAVKTAYERNPKIFEPLELFYGINIEERLERDNYWI
ncbi:MAG: 4-hydroxy-tetrahydrodipicolinate synthase [candidate division WOR-3 bacterium]